MKTISQIKVNVKVGSELEIFFTSDDERYYLKLGAEQVRDFMGDNYKDDVIDTIDPDTDEELINELAAFYSTEAAEFHPRTWSINGNQVVTLFRDQHPLFDMSYPHKYNDDSMARLSGYFNDEMEGSDPVSLEDLRDFDIHGWDLDLIIPEDDALEQLNILHLKAAKASTEIVYYMGEVKKSKQILATGNRIFRDAHELRVC